MIETNKNNGVKKMDYTTNQIVKGIKCGTFIILGSRTFGGHKGYQVKMVNPNNHAQIGRGEMFFEKNLLKAI